MDSPRGVDSPRALLGLATRYAACPLRSPRYAACSLRGRCSLLAPCRVPACPTPRATPRSALTRPTLEPSRGQLPNAPLLGAADDPFDNVASFYNFWFEFKSWRDFADADEYDVETAGLTQAAEPGTLHQKCLSAVPL